MASLVCNSGLQRSLVQTSQATSGSGPTYSATRHVQVMGFDDSAVAFAAAHTALNTGGAVANEFDAAFNAAPTRASQTTSHVADIPAATFVGVTVKRFSLHDDTAANVSASSASLFGGVDGQSMLKTADYIMRPTLDLVASNV